MTNQSRDKILLELQKDEILNKDEFDRKEFPYLWNLSSAFVFDKLPIPKIKKEPEFVFFKDFYKKKKHTSENEITIAEWNMVWEVGHLRADFFREKLPVELKWLKKF